MKGKEQPENDGKCCCKAGCCAGPLPRKMRLIELLVCSEQELSLWGPRSGQVAART